MRNTLYVFFLHRQLKDFGLEKARIPSTCLASDRPTNLQGLPLPTFYISYLETLSANDNK